MSALAVASVVVALALELAVGEPSTRFHPVAWFGRCIKPFDREWARSKLVGVAVALVLPAFAGAVATGAVAVVSNAFPAAGALVAGLVLFSATSLRMLLDTARDVVRMTEDDLDEAREHLLALAGRDASVLSAGQVRSAAVESAAENLADGLVAPALAFAVVAPASLPLAAGAAAWVKAVNTLDSMLGYRSKPVGWASARLDDAVMWVPARLSAALILVAAVAPGAIRRTSTWAREPPSPNSGWPMSALATVLDVRLEKPGVYVLNPDSTLPTVDDGIEAVRVVGVAGLLAYLGAGVMAWY